MTRKAGLETLILGESHEELHLPADMPALHLIQHIRDESHRFAITGHRARRAKARTTSTLEDIPGVGPKRRQALLKYLGGLQEVKKPEWRSSPKCQASARSWPSPSTTPCTRSSHW